MGGWLWVGPLRDLGDLGLQLSGVEEGGRGFGLDVTILEKDGGAFGAALCATPLDPIRPHWTPLNPTGPHWTPLDPTVAHWTPLDPTGPLSYFVNKSKHVGCPVTTHLEFDTGLVPSDPS